MSIKLLWDYEKNEYITLEPVEYLEGDYIRARDISGKYSFLFLVNIKDEYITIL